MANFDLMEFQRRVIQDLTVECEREKQKAKDWEKKYNAAIKLLRDLEWCNGCKHKSSWYGCKLGIWEDCNPNNDHYEFVEESMR